MIDDFLATALHFGVTALNAGKIQCRAGIPRGHRAGRTAPQANQHARAAQYDQLAASRKL